MAATDHQGPQSGEKLHGAMGFVPIERERRRRAGDAGALRHQAGGRIEIHGSACVTRQQDGFGLLEEDHVPRGMSRRMAPAPAGHAGDFAALRQIAQPILEIRGAAGKKAAQQCHSASHCRIFGRVG